MDKIEDTHVDASKNGTAEPVSSGTKRPKKKPKRPWPDYDPAKAVYRNLSDYPTTVYELDPDDPESGV